MLSYELTLNNKSKVLLNVYVVYSVPTEEVAEDGKPVYTWKLVKMEIGPFGGATGMHSKMRVEAVSGATSTTSAHLAQEMCSMEDTAPLKPNQSESMKSSGVVIQDPGPGNITRSILLSALRTRSSGGVNWAMKARIGWR